MPLLRVSSLFARESRRGNFAILSVESPSQGTTSHNFLDFMAELPTFSIPLFDSDKKGYQIGFVVLRWSWKKMTTFWDRFLTEVGLFCLIMTFFGCWLRETPSQTSPLSCLWPKVDIFDPRRLGLWWRMDLKKSAFYFKTTQALWRAYWTVHFSPKWNVGQNMHFCLKINMSKVVEEGKGLLSFQRGKSSLDDLFIYWVGTYSGHGFHYKLELNICVF